MIWIALLAFTCFLAYSNGANDNAKGIATLYGSGTADYARAIRWATGATLLGSIAAVYLAGELVRNFSGKGLVPDALVQSPIFAASVALGAALTVFTATRIGMPISTTHSLVGSLFGAGVIAMGSEFNYSGLVKTFAFPLIVSPLLAAICSLVAYLLFRRVRLALGIDRETCICVGEEPNQVLIPVAGPLSSCHEQIQTHASIKVGETAECVERYRGGMFGIDAQQILDTAHYISAGWVSFARGLNDTPKIAGLLVVLAALDIEYSLTAVGIAIALGGMIGARKVGETVSHRITPMNHGQGFTANLITGLLVSTASIHGMPVSTTHVSVGSIFAIATVSGDGNVRVIGQILASWLMTLPIAFAFSAATYWILTTVIPANAGIQ